ncbi:MAG: flagellar hook-basal body complex protein FliE [Rhodanobacteraceae bacterium]
MSPTSVAPLVSQLNTLAIQADRRPELTVGGTGTGASGGGPESFAQTLSHAIGEVNQSQLAAHHAEDAFATGQTGLPTAMLAVTRAQVEIDAAVQVRNRLVQAYNDIMQMGV